MTFKELPNGLYRSFENGLVYTKISETDAVIITSGKIVQPPPDEKVEKL